MVIILDRDYIQKRIKFRILHAKYSTEIAWYGLEIWCINVVLAMLNPLKRLAWRYLRWCAKKLNERDGILDGIQRM